jgi:two-component system NtrC family sensor kinase
VTARDALEAINFLKKHSVDGIISDMTMPGEVSTDDLLHWIASHRPELAARAIFTVSSARASEGSEFIRKSGCPVIQKPFAIEDFWLAVQTLLSSDVPAPLKI